MVGLYKNRHNFFLLGGWRLVYAEEKLYVMVINHNASVKASVYLIFEEKNPLFFSKLYKENPARHCDLVEYGKTFSMHSLSLSRKRPYCKEAVDADYMEQLLPSLAQLSAESRGKCDAVQSMMLTLKQLKSQHLVYGISCSH